MSLETSPAVQNRLITIESVNWIDSLISSKAFCRTITSNTPSRLQFMLEQPKKISLSPFSGSQEGLMHRLIFPRRIRAGGLTFVPVLATSQQIKTLLDFTFLRVARVMPNLRMAEPIAIRQTLPTVPFSMPTVPALNTNERAAIFDGGLGTNDLAAWTSEHVYEETSETVGALLMHGSEVTSTFLFGLTCSWSANRNSLHERRSLPCAWSTFWSRPGLV